MKKLFSLLLSASMIFGIFSISALAISEDSLYNVVMRRGPTCASCNMREMRLLHASHEPWILSHYEPCSYGSPLSDKYNDTIEHVFVLRPISAILRHWLHFYPYRDPPPPRTSLPYLNIPAPFTGGFFVLGAFPSLRRDKIPLRCFFRS